MDKCERKIESMFEEYDEKIRKTLKNICEHIYEEDMGKASMTMDGKTKVTIGMTSKGNIKIEKTIKTTKASEVE